MARQGSPLVRCVPFPGVSRAPPARASGAPRADAERCRHEVTEALPTPLAAVAVTSPLVAAMVIGSSGVTVAAPDTSRAPAARSSPPTTTGTPTSAALPVNARSAAWLSHMSPTRDLHPDFGPSYGAQPVPYGIPITIVVAGRTPRSPCTSSTPTRATTVRYPLGADTKIEGGRSAGGDRHAIVVDPSTCRLYETLRHQRVARLDARAPARPGR